jgi:hypothetical protein
MLVGRRNEQKQTWFRSDRVFNCNGQWYFHTREGIDVGPYDSHLEAEIESGLLRELIRSAAVSGDTLQVLREFILESFALGRPLNVMVADGSEPIVIERPAED